MCLKIESFKLWKYIESKLIDQRSDRDRKLSIPNFKILLYELWKYIGNNLYYYKSNYGEYIKQIAPPWIRDKYKEKEKVREFSLLILYPRDENNNR